MFLSAALAVFARIPTAEESNGNSSGARADAPTSPDLRIAVGFDGSCPHDPAGVKQEGENSFRIFPSWRSSPGIDEEAVGRSTRLGFKVVNGGRAASPVDLWIDWQYHDAYAAAALREYVFYIIPMANPDGVYNGLGALTAPRGADVCFIPYEPDEVMRAMKGAIDRVRPAVAIDLHNWQNKHTDGLLGLDPAVRERFVRFMPDQLESGKQWTIRDPKPLSPKIPQKELLRSYCERNFGAIAVTFEFPWFGRTTEDMRATGRKALWALLRALDPLPDNLR